MKIMRLKLEASGRAIIEKISGCRRWKDMIELAEEGKSDSQTVQSELFEHTCGAEDRRDCIMMKHAIMAEIRRSNVPVWVCEELEKKFECLGCWNALGRRAERN